MIENKKWLPTNIETIKGSLAFNSKDVLKKNIAYNIQYLEYLVKNIEEEETTTVIYRMKYKTFVVISASIIEAVFVTLLEERDLIPDDWKEGKHKHNEIDENTIEVTYIKKKNIPKKKRISFDEAISIVEKNQILNTTRIYKPIKVIRDLRNLLHLEKAQDLYNSDYNQFTEKIYHLTKLAIYLVMKDKSISNNTKYLEFLNPKESHEILKKCYNND